MTSDATAAVSSLCALTRRRVVPHEFADRPPLPSCDSLVLALKLLPALEPRRFCRARALCSDETHELRGWACTGLEAESGPMLRACLAAVTLLLAIS